MIGSSQPAAPRGGAQDRLLGRVLGDRYRVLSRLGEGGMGTVYLCEHAVLHRRFAVKVLRPDLASDGELVERFRNEAIAASRIGQENVVDVLDFGADEDGALYYVMEALDGRSLAAVIREEGTLPVVRALDLLEQISRALGAAHARGVVHRDVKPDNVFLVRREDGTERAKVIDFGISHVRAEGGERITRAGSIIGTPEYMAPEQASGDAVDHRADVYAAGVLAFEMLTGTLPIEAATPIATLVAQRTKTPEPPSRRNQRIPADVDALVLRALAKRPEDRFPTMEVLAAEAGRIRHRILRGEPQGSAAARPSRPRGETVALPGAQEPRRSRVALAAIAIGAFAAAAAVAAGFLWGRSRTDGSAAARSSPAQIPRPVDVTPAAAPAERAEARAAPEPPAPVAPPELVEERTGVRPPREVTAAPGRRSEPRAKPKPAAREGEPSAGDLKDPYSGSGGLKDPYQ